MCVHDFPSFAGAGFSIKGRIVLDFWRILRGEGGIKLRNYNYAAVVRYPNLQLYSASSFYAFRDVLGIRAPQLAPASLTELFVGSVLLKYIIDSKI